MYFSAVSITLFCAYVKFLDIFGQDFNKLGFVRLYGEAQKQEEILRG